MEEADPGGEGSADLGRLYEELSGQLLKIVRGGVMAPDAVIEDACQVAWSRLVRHHGRVRAETVLAWLTITARREAFRLIDRDARERSLEAEMDRQGVREPVDPLGPEEVVLQREQIWGISRLPPRQERLMWLSALGFSRQEIADRERCTLRTLERQLFKARRALAA